MVRAKLRLELISSEKARVAAFERRKKGLEKAADELSTLCGVDIGMIVYLPAQNNEANEPTIWPKNGHELLASLTHSYESRSGCDCRSRTYNLSAFFKDQTERTEEELNKLRKKMREAKYPKWDGRYNCLSGDQLKEIVSLLTTKIDAVRGRINSVKSSVIIYTESGASMDPSVQEYAVFNPSMWTDIMELQQPLAYYDAQAIIPYQRRMMMMNNSASCSQNTFSFGLNPASAVSLPSMWTDIMQQQQPLAYYDAQANIADQRRMMMMNNGASCSQNTFGFDENPDYYAYSCDEISAQNCGLGRGIMENVGANNCEPLMSYNMPNMAPIPQNRQRPLLSGAFPQMQAAQGADYV
ncbi:agamous-like MADS-box protein AGL92 [Sesamum indicum]|uniref:Agamous-like MADS-box protein AGL92 n=1 Tax=Sesamum indicum TaxID=4182 RepID=A0A6I9UQA5_SESIN|nr:agamous-like MADS-box protein AGL92 [Sesamum indicum]